MNKNQFIEFHKYLAMLKYEYTKDFFSTNLSSESKKDVEEIINAIDLLMKITIIDGEKQ